MALKSTQVGSSSFGDIFVPPNVKNLLLDGTNNDVITLSLLTIYGFDIIAGSNKVTGAFLDFSPIDQDHELCAWFDVKSKNYIWSKPRELPDWATSIFSKNIIAAGNINTEFELLELLELNKECLTYYLDTIKKHRLKLNFEKQINVVNYDNKQNHYCKKQKQNPHTPRVLKSLGFEDDKISQFINHCLFPEV